MSVPPAAAFPNMGVSLVFLQSILADPAMKLPMVSLARPDLTAAALDAMSLQDLRLLAKDLRVYSHLDGAEEFARYDDTAISRETWLAAVRGPPVTTTHVNLCLVKPRTQGLGGSYAATTLVDKADAGG